MRKLGGKFIKKNECNLLLIKLHSFLCSHCISRKRNPLSFLKKIGYIQVIDSKSLKRKLLTDDRFTYQ